MFFQFFMIFKYHLFCDFFVIHQTGVLGMNGGEPSKALPTYQAYMTDYGTVFRTFKYGAARIYDWFVYDNSNYLI